MIRCFGTTLLVFVLALSSFLPTSDANASDKLLDQTLKQLVEEVKQTPAGKGMSVGYQVISLEDGRVLAENQGNKTFVPGSVAKLWVQGAAMTYLPEDPGFETELYVRGTVRENGVLKGDVILKGKGDPALSVQQLEKLARSLSNQGIRRVAGNILVDDTLFDSVPLGNSWMWDLEPYPASAQIGALSVNGNTVEVSVIPGWKGQAPRIKIYPAPSYVKVINRAQTTFGKQESLSITRVRGKNEIVVTGTIGVHHRGVKVQRTVDDPGYFTGSVLKDLLKKQGIRFQSRSRLLRGKVGSRDKRIGTVPSLKRDPLLRHMVKQDDALYAEMLLKHLGVSEKKEGSEEEGISVLRSFAKEITGDDRTFRPKDGSGRSRMSVMAPAHMTNLLMAMDKHIARETFFSSFHKAGEEGSLKKRMKGTLAEDNLAGVTTSAKGISGLTGIVTGGSGERLAFSIMVNGVKEKQAAEQLEDRIGETLASYPKSAQIRDGLEVKEYPLSPVLDPLLDLPGYEGVMDGVVVQSVDTGKILYAKNPHTRMTPASNTKLFTAATALNTLGPQYRYKTSIYLTGPLQKGVVRGDIVIQGRGDPSMASKGSLQVQDGVIVENIARDLKDRGIRKVEGGIQVDSSAFSDDVYGKGWAWDDESEYYQPQITALSVNRGTVRFDYLPGKKEGDPIRLSLTPKTEYVKVLDQVVTGPAGSKNTLKIQRDRGKNVIRLTGSLPLDFEGDYTRVPVEQPHLYTGTVLKEAMEEEGIRFTSGKVKERRAETKLSPFASYQSEPLSEIVRYLNKVSDNFYAEMILKTVGLKVAGEGTAENGLDEIDRYMKKIGLPEYYDMKDGSGLTRYNLFTPLQLTSLLTAQSKASHFAAFYHSLPIAGVDGTLRNRMKETAAEGNLSGKTGSLTHVSSLAGYVRTKDGELLCFSIIMNGYTEKSERALQDQIGAALADFSEKTTKERGR
ncbi:D-alanyl-D-alanine carboxypeptidase/D-alanyl-D-alanine endopeptidase [Kroppenstedtia pulmonis]|nr:D-alanyl-D-alanine carboxypeptidase/D-alanyl-D-alanine-endopeptidase [Kroppenstedtia pulmonis]